MKPSTIIVMSVGLIITISGFFLCLFSKSTIEKKYSDKDLFSYDGDFYEIIDGETVRKKDFSDVVYKTVGDMQKEVQQDVKVLSLVLSGVDKIEIVGNQDRSEVEVYNMTPGTYSCEIASGMISVSNVFDQTMVFNYVSDVVTNFNGIRRFFNPDIFEKKVQKVIVNIDDDDLLNRIDLNLTDCKDVTVRNLTCSLDCKITLNNSSVVFDSCVFKDPDIIDIEEEDQTADEETGEIETVRVINHYLSIDLNMKNGSSFESRACKFSSVDAIVNKRAITEANVNENEQYSASDIGKLISSGQKPCVLKLDLSAYDKLYGFDLINERDADYKNDSALTTKLNGVVLPDEFAENEDSDDYPQVYVRASNCDLSVTY